LAKLAKLKERGVISEDEFQQMKQDLIKKDGIDLQVNDEVK
jgi:Short C-terminal domain